MGGNGVDDSGWTKHRLQLLFHRLPYDAVAEIVIQRAAMILDGRIKYEDGHGVLCWDANCINLQ